MSNQSSDASISLSHGQRTDRLAPASRGADRRRRAPPDSGSKRTTRYAMTHAASVR